MHMSVLLDGTWRTIDIFTNQHIILVGIPGAFTPTCETQVPTFMKEYNTFKQQGIDEIYCISTNDQFVLKAWAQSMHIRKSTVKLISDGNAIFTKNNNLLDDYSHRGFGIRSKRYAMIVKNGMNVYTGYNENAFAKTMLQHISLKHF